jgi:ROK family protein
MELRSTLAAAIEATLEILQEVLDPYRRRNRISRQALVLRSFADVNTFVYVTVGTGVGGGGLIEGRPMRGLAQPEMGHMRVPHDREADRSRASVRFTVIASKDWRPARRSPSDGERRPKRYRPTIPRGRWGPTTSRSAS